MTETSLFVRTVNGNDDNDPWDDHTILRTYESAFEKVKKELLLEKSWKEEDFCRCPYSEDGIIYEGQITKIMNEKECIVKYIGYDNEEAVLISKLRPSKGAKERRKQIQESQQGDKMDVDSTSGRDASKSDAPAQSKPKGNIRKEPSKKLENFCVPPPITAPPPLSQLDFVPPSSNEARNAMLMSWYMSGYHTGYYEGMKNAGKTPM